MWGGCAHMLAAWAKGAHSVGELSGRVRRRAAVAGCVQPLHHAPGRPAVTRQPGRQLEPGPYPIPFVNSQQLVTALVNDGVSQFAAASDGITARTPRITASRPNIASRVACLGRVFWKAGVSSPVPWRA